MSNTNATPAPPRDIELVSLPGPVRFWERPVAGVLLLTIVTCIAYLPALRGEFILDDNVYLADCSLIKASNGLYRFWFTTEPIDYWPLTNTSFWIEWRLWGLNSTGYHVTNLLLHIASALLIWKILNMLSIPGAWLAALLFAVHPVNVESVAWISQRKNTLSMLFFLLSILWYLKADNGMGLRRERSAERRWYWLSLSAFVLAMLSKGSVAVLPLILLLLAWWQRGSVTKWDLLRSAPFFLVAVALAVVNVWFQTHGMDIEVRHASLLQRLLGAGATVWFYLYKSLLPLNLMFIYPPWNMQPGELRWWLPLAAGLVVTALLLWQRNTRLGRPLLFAWLYFCVALLPVMGFADVGFMQHSLVADRYQHVAIIGVVALAAAGMVLLYRHARGIAKSAVIATAALAATLLTLLSWNQSSLYGDPVTLYEATLEGNANNFLLHNNLGAALAKTGHSQEAIEHYQRALQLKPDYVDTHNNLATLLTDLNRPDEAIEHFQQALQLKPDLADTHCNLGIALFKFGRAQQAIEHFHEALRLRPDYAEAHYGLGIALLEAGKLPEAIECFTQAVRSNPELPQAYFYLGYALTQSGRVDEAIPHLRTAVRLNPEFLEAHFNLARLLAKSGRFEEAIRHYQQALRLKPDYETCYDDLVKIYSATNRPDQAIASAQRALELARAAGQTERMQRIEAWLESHRDRMSTPPDVSPPSNSNPPPP